LNTSPNPVFVISPVTAENVSVLVGATTAPGAPFQVSVSSILAPATSVTATVTPFANNPLAFGTPNPIFTASSSTLTLTTSPITLTINSNPTNLPVGTYQGNFTISSPAVSNTAVVTVNLTVYPLGCQFSVSPSGTVSLTNAVPANGSTPVTVPGAFMVTPGTGPGCTSGVTWTATSDSAWIVITGGNTGNGGAASGGTFNALSNTRSNSRTGTITITPSAGSPVVIQFVQPASTAPLLYRQVTSLYQTVLGRDPDSGGYAFWNGIGATQGPSALGLMADSFLVSPESFNTNMAVIAAYQAGTGAPPTFAAFSNSVMQVRLGNQTIPGLFTALMNGNSAYSGTTLYQNLLNRSTTAGDAACISSGMAACFQTLIGFTNAGSPTPYFVNNNEFQSTGTFQNLHAGAAGDHSNPLYINMLYFVTLGRQADQGGLNFWDGIANGGGAGLLFQGNTGLPTRLQIEGTGVPNQGFIGSAEFQSHFQ